MRTRVPGWRLLALVVALVGLERAAGQSYGTTIESLINRPGSSGPSAEIGGRFTSRQLQPLSTTRMSTPTFGQSQYHFRGRNRRQRSGGSGMSAPQLGLSSGLGSAGSMSFYGGGATGSLAGMAGPRRLFLPAPDLPVGFVPSITAHQYTPRDETTPFQNLFGLQPKPVALMGETLPLPNERLRERTEGRALQSVRIGLELFKEATIEPRDPRTERYPNCTECRNFLLRARERLDLARLLDPEAHLPLVLMAHCCLEDDQPTLALNYLMKAHARQPGLVFSRSLIFLTSEEDREAREAVLADLESRGYDGVISTDDTWPVIGLTHELTAEEAIEIAALTGVCEVRRFEDYFGDVREPGQDSQYLVAQLRRYWYHADANAGSPEAMALQAYCAWRLGDEARAAGTLAQLESMVWDEKHAPSPNLLDFVGSLRTELQRVR